jgi:glucose-6-phosphate isomerase
MPQGDNEHLRGVQDDDRTGATGEAAVRRLFAGDHTLWRDDPTEISDRLGWLPVVNEVAVAYHQIRERCDAIVQGIDHVLLMGMGGSSLFPEVLARTYPRQDGYPQLHVLDTTHPAAIGRMGRLCPPDRTLHVASSKSGTTIETRSHLEWAWERCGQGAQGRFAVITDPGSELGELAKQRGFVQVFENRPDIGGRYSALSLFGIVPALLAGFDAESLVRGGLDGLQECGPDQPPSANPALAMARAMANGVAIGNDKLTFRLEPEIATFGLWLEQLVAESLGKDGTGLVPVVGERPGPPRVYGDDRTWVDLGVTAAPRSVGRAVVVAEVATALCGALIGVQPFDQPDVAAAKQATNVVLTNKDSSVPVTRLEELLGKVQPGDHLAIQAFVDPEGPYAEPLEDARHALRDELRVAVTLGFGPRFLHSTGQLHKGGPSNIVCVQVFDDQVPDIPIPGRGIGFGELLAAQAAGDLKVLTDRGRAAGRVPLHQMLEVASS